jgi:hypothetical protein
MKSVQIVANALHYLTRIASLLFLSTAIYAFIVLFLSLYTRIDSLPIELKTNGSFVIFFPFTKAPFLLGDYTSSYFLVSTSTIALYSLFLWLLSCVFKAFRQKRLFIPKSVSRLERFYLFNLSVPTIFLLFLAFSGQEIRDAIIIVFLHLMIGVFAFFMAAIFKQGLLLQEEQDLTL